MPKKSTQWWDNALIFSISILLVSLVFVVILALTLGRFAGNIGVLLAAWLAGYFYSSKSKTLMDKKYRRKVAIITAIGAIAVSLLSLLTALSDYLSEVLNPITILMTLFSVLIYGIGVYILLWVGSAQYMKKIKSKK